MKIKGLDQFMNHLNGVENRLNDSVKQAVKQNALEMETKAKMLAPVDTGNLRRNINTSVKESSDSISAEVASNAEYSIYVEYGTSKQQAQPFMNPAFVAQQTQFETDMRQALKKGVDG